MAENILQGGVQVVAPIAPQIVYLDFDGELTRYNGEILTIDNVEVQHSLLSDERIQYIVAELNLKNSGKDVIFVTERPENTEYSTVYIGKTDAFVPYGDFIGLAETIDAGNLIKDDNAFVFLDHNSSNDQIISVINHEIGHIAEGKTHSVITDSLADYAENYYGSVQTSNTNKNGYKSDYKTYTINLNGASYATITISFDSHTITGDVYLYGMVVSVSSWYNSEADTYFVGPERYQTRSVTLDVFSDVTIGISTESNKGVPPSFAYANIGLRIERNMKL